jgi:hypothetical protein
MRHGERGLLLLLVEILAQIPTVSNQYFVNAKILQTEVMEFTASLIARHVSCEYFPWIADELCPEILRRTSSGTLESNIAEMVECLRLWKLFRSTRWPLCRSPSIPAVFMIFLKAVLITSMGRLLNSGNTSGPSEGLAFKYWSSWG